MIKKITILLLINLSAATSAHGIRSAQCDDPKGGYFVRGVVANAKVAAKVAELILKDIYGEYDIAQQMPLIVKEEGGVYTITGNTKKIKMGGVAKVKICRSNGEIKYIWHSK